MTYSPMNTHPQLLQKAKMKLVEASIGNSSKRLNEILDIINEFLPTSFDPFIITDNNKKIMLQDIKTCILSWQGNGIHSSTQNSYTQASIQWFTKNNTKIYGNCLFYPTFVYILRFCNNISGMNNANKIHLFVSILLKLFNTNLTSNTNQSLIPIQCLIYPNKFLTILKQFIVHFYTQYKIDTINISTIIAILNHLLNKIENNLLSDTDNNNQHVEYNLFTIKPPPIPILARTESKSTDSDTSIFDIPLLSSIPSITSTSSLNSTQMHSNISNNTNVNIDMQNEVPIHVNYENKYMYGDIEPNQEQNQSFANNMLMFMNKKNNKHNKNNNSIVVKIDEHQSVKYNIISFNPLRVEKIVL
eukprot:210974_1